MCMLALGVGSNAQITVGSGNTTSSGIPWHSCYGYSYNQMIYTKPMINAAGSITSLTIKSSGTLPTTSTGGTPNTPQGTNNDFKIYIGHTTKSNFASTTDWEPLSNLTLVYDGSLTMPTTSGSDLVINLTTPFAYNNTDNLIIAFDENSPGYACSYTWVANGTQTNMNLYNRSDTVNPDPSAPPTGVRASATPQIILGGLVVTSPPSCVTITAPADAATNVSVTPTISWPAAGGATSYDLAIGTTAGGTDVMPLTDVGNITSYVIPVANALSYNSTYYVTVYPKSGLGSATGCTSNMFTTTATIPCPTVTLPAAAATGVSLTPSFTWNAVTGATSYNITIGTTSGGSDILNAVDVGNVTTWAYTGPALSNNTKYFYTVNALVGATSSASCTVRNFTTLCGVVSAPYIETFASGVIAPCWTAQNPTTTSTSANVNWKFTGNADYGANLANNGRASGTYAWVDASSPYANEHTVELLSPSINLTGLAAPFVSFDWFKNHSASTSTTVSPSTYDNNKLTVDINDGSGWVTIFTSTTNAQVWRTEGIALAASYIGATVQLRFTVDKNVGTNPYFYDDILLDNVEVKETPTCLAPNTLAYSNLTSTGADVTWVAPTTLPAIGYDVYHSSVNTAPTSTTTPQYVGLTTTMQNIPGTPGSVFYVWVRSNCSASSQSTWVGPVTYTIPFPAPANDVCSGAIVLTPGATFAQNAITTTNVGATTDGTTTCQSSRGNNVWYSVVVPASGSLTIETDAAAGSPLTDTVLSVHGGACGSTFTNVSCDDDTGNGNFSKVVLSGQTPGETLYVSIWRYTSNATNLDGQFQISAYDASLSTSEIAQVKNNLTVYPNPFADVLNISDVKNVKSVSVIDIAGRLVKTIEKPNSALQLGELKSGMYMVVLNMNDGSKQTIKAIKK